MATSTISRQWLSWPDIALLGIGRVPRYVAAIDVVIPDCIRAREQERFAHAWPGVLAEAMT